ncbi:hypothetical protein HDU92_005147 [Lobulomyces angularis]|nr:hypothetical protein HDU92_005147 [Lobulomyces angularis]
MIPKFLITLALSYIVHSACTTQTVSAGEGCWAIAQRCGITVQRLEQLNPGKCNNLQVGQKLCCSEGSLPGPTIPPGNSDGTCNFQKVVAGDGCWSVAQRCANGIDSDTLNQINNGACSNLQIGKKLCCTQGTLPKPKPDANGNCIVYQIKTGDGCWSIANEIGVSQAELEGYNRNNWNWKGCDKLALDQKICVSPGNPPADPRPKPDANGNCFAYNIKANDGCWSLAVIYGLTVADIETFNKNTFHWVGCAKIQTGMNICLSSGSPPLPPIDPNAQCGLTSVNKLTGERNVKCALNACCSTWGYCGTTEEFCIEKPNFTGCQSNCGMGYPFDKTSPAPHPQYRIGYYESWTVSRGCEVMTVSQIPVSKYTHIHFAFASVSSLFQVEIDPKVMNIFTEFCNLSGVKKVLSFGGWAFNDPPTQTRFTDMVTSHRSTFISSVLTLLSNYNLDGIDIDWEYPSAPDRGGKDSDAQNYLLLVKELRAAMNSRYSLSIAAPASLWYLRGFAIAEMSAYLDYIVYMTYDIHGQWDYSIKWTGPFLKSHVNWPETVDALSLIVRAGVPSSKVLLGIGLYGRSFKQSDPNCSTPLCTFQYQKADPGPCTKEGGYLSMNEIKNIIKGGSVRSSYYDQEADSMVLTFGNDHWVAYTDSTINEKRRQEAIRYNLGGTVEWAIDLDHDLDIVDPNMKSRNCKTNVNSLDEITGMDPICVDSLIVGVISNDLQKALGSYKDIVANGKYDRNFGIYQHYLWQSLPKEIDRFVGANGDKYFNCQEHRTIFCCKNVGWMGDPRGCTPGNDCVGGKVWTKSSCPKYIPGIGNAAFENIIPVKYELRDANGFNDAMLKEVGVQPTWIQFSSRTVKAQPSCWMVPKPGPECFVVWEGLPGLNSKFEVPNPKAAIEPMLQNYTNGLTGLDRAEIDMMALGDVIDASVVGVYMASQSVESMQKISELGEKIEEEQRKEMILSFINFFLMLIPFVGPAAVAAEGAIMTVIINSIRVLGVLTDVGMAVYDLITSGSPFAFLFGLIGLFGAFGDAVSMAAREANFAKLAGIKRGLKDSELISLGPKPAEMMKKIDGLKLKCKA